MGDSRVRSVGDGEGCMALLACVFQHFGDIWCGSALGDSDCQAVWIGYVGFVLGDYGWSGQYNGDLEVNFEKVAGVEGGMI